VNASCAYPGCGYERPQSASAAGGSGTVYPPDGGSSTDGDAGGLYGDAGEARPTAESPAERLRLAAETLDGDAAGLAAPLAAILRSSAKRAAAELRDFVDPTTPAALAWVRQIHADELAVADAILGATR